MPWGIWERSRGWARGATLLLLQGRALRPGVLPHLLRPWLGSAGLPKVHSDPASPAAGWLQQSQRWAVQVPAAGRGAGLCLPPDREPGATLSPEPLISFCFDLISGDHFSCSLATSVHNFKHSLWFGEVLCRYSSYWYYSYNRFKLLRYCWNGFWPRGDKSTCHFTCAAAALLWNVWRLVLW